MNTTRPTQSIKNDILAAEQAIRNNPVPNIAALKLKVSELTTAALLDPSAKSDLLLADLAVKAGIQTKTEHDRLQNTLARLKDELQQAEEAERLAIKEDQRRQVSEARGEWVAACKEMVRKAYRYHMVSRKYGGQGIAPDEFNIKGMVPVGWQGFTSQHMIDGSLSWLNSENDERKAA